jgi:hypothetical protein
MLQDCSTSAFSILQGEMVDSEALGIEEWKLKHCQPNIQAVSHR